MIRTIFRFFKGYVRIRIEGYSPERFLNICRNQKISIWNLMSSDHSYELCMSVKGFRKIRPIAKKTNTQIRLIEKRGLPFWLFRYKKRKLFFFGVLLAMCLVKVYSLYIWDIHIEGNQKFSEIDLVRFLKSKEVYPFMPKSEVDCETIEKEIRQAYDEIVWVSAALDGSRIAISIKENDDTVQPETETPKVPTDIVALDSGKITRMITRKGTPMVHPGDIVKKGDILVQGNVAEYNDEKEVTGYRQEHADADIYADVTLNYQETMSVNYVKKQYLTNKRKCIPYISLGSYSIVLGTVKYKNIQTEVYRTEKQIRAGENNYLPVFYGFYEIKPYENQTFQYTKKQCQSRLSADFKKNCEELKKKGIQISGNSVKIHWYGNRASAEGNIYINENIVQTQDAQILDIERNTENESSGTGD